MLWVDDCRPLLDLYQKIFGDLGFEVQVTASPQEALDHLALNAVDVAILDFEMPEMNGCALAALIKERHPELPVILYSASSDIPLNARRWVDAICSKTVPREHLLALIEATLADREVSLAGSYAVGDRMQKYAFPGPGSCEVYPAELQGDSSAVLNHRFRTRFTA